MNCPKAYLSPLASVRSPSIHWSAQAFAFHTPRRYLASTTIDRANSVLGDLSSIIDLPTPQAPALTYKPPRKPHRLHIYATKHNTHITLTRGNREPLISVSAGNIGFKKAARGSYDAAYQLGMFVIGRITNQGLLGPGYPGKGGPVKDLEVVLRDFGPGRQAVTKLLLGAEGAALRSRVLRVMDSTRIKFGGTRSPNPRRL